MVIFLYGNLEKFGIISGADLASLANYCGVNLLLEIYSTNFVRSAGKFKIKNKQKNA